MTPDRTHFVAHLDALLSQQDRSDDEPHSLMYVLLDNFTMIRDEIGVLESESVVREVAKIFVITSYSIHYTKLYEFTLYV